MDNIQFLHGYIQAMDRLDLWEDASVEMTYKPYAEDSYIIYRVDGVEVCQLQYDYHSEQLMVFP